MRNVTGITLGLVVWIAVAATLLADEVPAPGPQVLNQGPRERALPKFLQRSIAWLITAQHSNGGWGAGSHAHQDIRDPHQVQVDPATTAFAGLALLRVGHTPFQGEYRDHVRRAVEYLVGVVETADEDGARITNLQGTQPQTKMGPLVDTALTAQYLARVLPTIPRNEPLYARVDRALDTCLAKLARSQEQDGSWGRQGGWAPVLQSSLSCTALEIASTNGKDVDPLVLDRAIRYQKSNIDAKTGRAATDAAAGVELYAFAGGGRSNAAEARVAQDRIQEAQAQGRVAVGTPVTTRSLHEAGLPHEEAKRLAAAFDQNQIQLRRLQDETLLAGFGNNGGEEFLSYLLTSETLVISGGDQFRHWDKKMRRRLKKIQNDDGSWNGHHCITSPVFCTAAVVQCLTAERDADFLVGIAKKQGATAVASANK